MPNPQLMGTTGFPYDTINSRKVGFRDLPARMQNEVFSQTGEYQPQYQDPDVIMHDRTFNFDNGASMNIPDEGWESCSPKACLHIEGGPDSPKPKKTRRRKPKAPLDEETAQKKRREALDKNKQAAAKCRARKKQDEHKRQAELQIMRSENQILRSELSQMEELVRSAKLEVGKHTGCDDDSLSKAKKLIEDIESKCERLNEERRNLQARHGYAHTGFEDDDMVTVSGAGEHDGSGDFNASRNNSRSDRGSFSEQQEWHSASHNDRPDYPAARNELQRESVTETNHGIYPPFMSNVSDVYGATPTGATLNPLWVSTQNLPKPSEDSLFDSGIASARSFDSMVSQDLAAQLQSSMYPESPLKFAADMPLFDSADPMLPTSTVLDTNFDASTSLFHDDFDFDIGDPQTNATAMEMDMLSQVDSTYESQSPSSSNDSKNSSPEWETLKLKRPELDPGLRRDSALGPEVNEEQLLKGLSIQGGSAFKLQTESKPSLLERRKRRISGSN